MLLPNNIGTEACKGHYTSKDAEVQNYAGGPRFQKDQKF